MPLAGSMFPTGLKKAVSLAGLAVFNGSAKDR
ncbi:hypothetical protein AABM17_752 [Neisseria musculi]|uniref:Uncharacterized protein n=1 Tax=Neisseria musculi TaxID=1815583 RepID=A0A7H1MBU7_9NEIS|nr:hypothetical protein H7A79_0752 [Neisseria musculi]